MNAWRLAQHGLSPRLGRQDIGAAATRTGGIQAQVMSAAELALWARQDGLTLPDVQAALWQDHTLVKTWAMRGTLHLLAASDFPLYVAARSLLGPRNWIDYFAYYGVSREVYEAYLALASQVLSSEPMTREQFAAVVAQEAGSPALRSMVQEKGWGSPLKPLAWRGDLCFGPSQGQNVTFVHPARWLGGWQEVEPHQALQEVARRYLRSFGPATPVDFAMWWGGNGVIGPSRNLFRSLQDELEMVAVEGWQAYALRTTLEPLH